jgi:membrane protein
MLDRVKKSGWWTAITGAGHRWSEVDGDQRAAAIAYYLLISLLPVIIILVNAVSLFVEREAAASMVIKLINQYTPLTSGQERAAVDTVQSLLDARGAISVVAFVLLLGGLLQFQRTMLRTINRVWRTPLYRWWRGKLKGIALLGVTGSALMVGMLLPVLARLVGQWLLSFPAIPGWTFTLVFKLRPWVALFYGLTMIYRLAPNRDTRFSEVWPSALGATIVIWLGELLFLVYAVNVGRFNLVYGTLGVVMALFLWIYLSSSVGVFGVCVCAVQAETRERNA